MMQIKPAACRSAASFDGGLLDAPSRPRRSQMNVCQVQERGRTSVAPLRRLKKKGGRVCALQPPSSLVGSSRAGAKRSGRPSVAPSQKGERGDRRCTASRPSCLVRLCEEPRPNGRRRGKRGHTSAERIRSRTGNDQKEGGWELRPPAARGQGKRRAIMGERDGGIIRRKLKLRNNWCPALSPNLTLRPIRVR